MTTLTLAAAVTLGNLRYVEQVTAVTVELGLLPSVSTATVRFPVRADVSAVPGDDAVLELDGGEGAATVLTGAVLGVRRGAEHIDVVVADAGARLAAVRPTTTFDASMVGDSIRSLAADAGVDVGLVSATMQLATYAAHQQRTAAEHVAHLAHLAGAIAAIDAEGALSVTAWPAGPATAAVRYDREFVSYRAERCEAPVAGVAVGGGPAGTPLAPDALQQTVEALTAGSDEPAPDTRWLPTAVLRTPSTVESATAAANTAAGAASTRLLAQCWLQPALRPGTVLEVQEVPTGVDAGPWLLTAVVHRLAPGGGFTDLAGVTAAGAGGDLVGALAGAVGGLL
jgi:hypothetical protein